MKLYGGNSASHNKGAHSQKGAHSAKHNAGEHKAPDIEVQQSSRMTAPAAGGPGSPAPKKKKSRVGWIIAVGVLLAVVAGVLIWWFGDQRAPDVAEENPGAQGVEITDTETREIGHYYTVLIAGYDQLGFNTDTLMVARYDAVDKKIDVVSIPRDTLVNVEWPVKKVNTIYQAQGNSIEALMSGIEDLVGFQIDNYVFLNTQAFVELVNCVGGVYFDVPCDMDYDDYTDTNMDGTAEYIFTIHVKQGPQLLNGYDALGVCRFRQYGMGDIDRISVQQDFLKAAFDQIVSMGNALKAPEMLDIVARNLTTDLSAGNIKWYITQLLGVESENLNFYMLAGNYSCLINNMSYVSINIPDWLGMINGYLNPLKNPITEDDCNILYQIDAEPNKYEVTPGNYAVTGGGEIAGGLNFYKNW